jgi:hypothetical protein
MTRQRAMPSSICSTVAFVKFRRMVLWPEPSAWNASPGTSYALRKRLLQQLRRVDSAWHPHPDEQPAPASSTWRRARSSSPTA